MQSIVRQRGLIRQFFTFACVGAAGFVVDSAVLLVLLRATDAGLYFSRLVSFLCAATFTWAVNRLWTFRGAAPSLHAGAQWLRFVVINSVGGLINLGIYAYLISQIGVVARWPVIGVAAGSLAGLLFNFVLSSSLVFRSHSDSAAGSGPTRTT
jgi:putative flippase GtrA